ncbi:O-succinylbenzoic acid--CoA ligase [Candidatus Nanopelagicaceae bacterium]
MDNSSQRKILRVSPACEIPQLAGEITSALVGDGPTLGFGEITSEFAAHYAAVVIGTSGSSGAAKEVALTATALISSARASNKFINAKPGDTWSLLLPLTHIAAVNVIVRAIELGTLPMDVRDCEGDYPRADYTSIVPTQLFRALNGDNRLLDHLKSAKAVLVGGAALSQSIRNQAELAGIKVITTYGMTETCGGCVYDGELLDGVDVEIRGGKIFIRGPILASSISLDAGWYETSDLGELENEKLKVIGRADDVIITGGENLSLNAVEASLNSAFPAIEFAAFAVEDPQWGQSLQIAVVGSVLDDEIFAHLEKDLGAFAKPKGIHHLASLPLLGIGKVDRKSLAKGVAHE